MAGRTNPVRDLFSLIDDNDNALDPAQGLPGYLDDWYANPQAGLIPDPGWPAYLRIDPENTGVPNLVYRRSDDPYADPDDAADCSNWFGGECLVNNGVPSPYLWRDNPNDYVPAFSAVDTLNQVASNNNAPGSSDYSLVNFNAQQGET